jgi:hypothetical protein
VFAGAAAGAVGASTAAQALGRWHYGWHRRHHVANRSCYRKEWVQTSSGWRRQWENICDPFDLLL